MPDETLPPRPRRRLLTPVTGVLAAVVLVGAGFIGGVQVQKGEQDPGTSATASRSPGGFPGAGAQRGQGAQAGGGAAPTSGEVKSKRGSTLYVETSDGTTVRVRTDADSKVTRTAAASARGVFPGDTVLVEGETAKSGTVTASRVVATAASAASAGGGPVGMFGGGPPPGAAPTGG